jgi:hypothetical protein
VLRDSGWPASNTVESAAIAMILDMMFLLGLVIEQNKN